MRTFRKWRYYGLLLMLSVAFGSVMMLVMLVLFSREMSMVDAQFVQPERIIRYAWCDSAFDAAFDARTMTALQQNRSFTHETSG